jgi:hypothetical protein
MAYVRGRAALGVLGPQPLNAGDGGPIPPRWTFRDKISLPAVEKRSASLA